jgi:hypothetical protein
MSLAPAQEPTSSHCSACACRSTMIGTKLTCSSFFYLVLSYPRYSASLLASNDFPPILHRCRPSPRWTDLLQGPAHRRWRVATGWRCVSCRSCTSRADMRQSACSSSRSCGSSSASLEGNPRVLTLPQPLWSPPEGSLSLCRLRPAIVMLRPLLTASVLSDLSCTSRTRHPIDESLQTTGLC